MAVTITRKICIFAHLVDFRLIETKVRHTHTHIDDADRWQRRILQFDTDDQIIYLLQQL